MREVLFARVLGTATVHNLLNDEHLNEGWTRPDLGTFRRAKRKALPTFSRSRKPRCEYQEREWTDILAQIAEIAEKG
jgi:hypothetical protein